MITVAIPNGSWLLLKNTILHKTIVSDLIMNLLEHVISKRTIVPDPEWLKPLWELPIPNNISTLWWGMGMFVQYFPPGSFILGKNTPVNINYQFLSNSSCCQRLWRPKKVYHQFYYRSSKSLYSSSSRNRYLRLCYCYLTEAIQSLYSIILQNTFIIRMMTFSDKFVPL